MANSTRSAGQSKPTKPYPSFPLFPHATQRWAKKIRGKLHYFGPWRDPNAALAKYLDQKDDLHAGRTPRQRGGELTVKELLNRFLAAKESLVESGDITRSTHGLYYYTARRVLAFFGEHRVVAEIQPEEFTRFRASLAGTMAPLSLKGALSRIRGIFAFAISDGLIQIPVRFGSGFRSPSAKVLLQARYAKGLMMFEADEIHKLIDAADVNMRAMIHLGANCAFGPHDIATLPESAIDIKSAWCIHPRPKTGAYRRAPLWPETIAALRSSLLRRPAPQRDDACFPHFFLTEKGTPYLTDGRAQLLVFRFRRLMHRVDVYRPRRGVYGLRRTFETVASESIDQVAVDFIMGPSRGGMASVYRQRISDERLQAVVEHVRGWLFPDGKTA